MEHVHGAREMRTRGTPPLYDRWDGQRRRITTRSKDAQRYFDQGLNLVYAFNHGEAARHFEEAARRDPSCAMCLWGIAYANGPHYNDMTLPPQKAKAAHRALRKARTLAARATPVERDLIDALAKRHAADPTAEREPLDRAYARAMRDVHARRPDDVDAAVLYAEALMNLRPWRLWTTGGKAQPGTREAVASLEGALARDPDHPGALHFYIHAVEASPEPERAERAADRLARLDLLPGSGHLVHMPAHVYVRVGRWADAAAQNRRAVAADRAFIERTQPSGMFPVYMAHNDHFLAWVEMYRGRSRDAMVAAKRGVAKLPPELASEVPQFYDYMINAPLLVAARFGRWDEVLATPRPERRLLLSTVLWHYTRGLALSARGRLDAADAELDAARKASRRIPEDYIADFNKARDVAAIATHILAGDLASRRGDHAEAIASFERAVELEDRLVYAEPSNWYHQPARHYLGAALLDAGRASEAEAVYRADLRRHPNNGWALFGLARALRAQGSPHAGEAARRFRAAWKDADVTLRASRF